jgi:hypothetical protein
LEPIDAMKTVTITDARKNLGKAQAARGEDIGSFPART